MMMMMMIKTVVAGNSDQERFIIFSLYHRVTGDAVRDNGL